jgi:RNA polymerase sigma-70 factor (ECF subfamily)
MSEGPARDRLLEWEGCSIAGDLTETLTVDELGDAIRSFSRADKLRLRKAGCLFSGGTELDWESLLQEAVLRALDGTRRCPRSAPPVKFLINAMRSLASAERDSVTLRPTPEPLSATRTEGAALSVPEPGRDAEALLLAREDYALRLAALEDLFSDDEEGLMIVMGDMDGLDADAIRELTGLDHKGLATARRRIRRRVEAKYPGGFGV